MRKGNDIFRSNRDIARRVYRAFKTPVDGDRTTDPILAFHFRGREDRVILRCNKIPECSVKGAGQDAGEVKFFAYSDFAEYGEQDVLFRLKDDIALIELYKKGAIEALTFGSWNEFIDWLQTLDENGVQISLKLPHMVYQAVKGKEPSMQNYIVEAIKRSLRDPAAQ
jgi:hypothetical protein